MASITYSPDPAQAGGNVTLPLQDEPSVDVYHAPGWTIAIVRQ